VIVRSLDGVDDQNSTAGGVGLADFALNGLVKDSSIKSVNECLKESARESLVMGGGGAGEGEGGAGGGGEGNKEEEKEKQQEKENENEEKKEREEEEGRKESLPVKFKNKNAVRVWL
jgi:hypothetical protein